jgi:hypothetical protein
MKSARSPAGPRGLALLALTAVAGLIMAVHGWSHHRLAVAPSLAAGASSASAPAASPPGAATVRPSPSARPSRPSGPAATPGATSAAPAPSAAASTGPLLATQPYAQYSYRVWPGTPDTTARAALTGLSVSVHRQGPGISVAAGVSGQPGPARFYPQGARVYIVEASMGDDSGTSDYDMGDDGLIVTNAQGRILS